MSKVVLLRHFSTIIEADLAKSVLDSNGIEGFVQKGFMAPQFASPSADLFVLESDAKRAKELLGN